MIMTSLREYIKAYQDRGFKTRHILGNGEFDSNRKGMDGT